MTGPVLSPPHVGTELHGRYRLVRHIARGGMGDVFEAEDQQLRRPVAVKVFRAVSPGDRARFDAEVRVLAGLHHPGLVQVFDAGAHGNDAYVVLELIDGPPLSQRLADAGPLPPPEVADLGRQLADALDHIHGHGVVHRDVTPSNVLCGPDGRPRLVDFGIARLLDTTRITGPSMTVGTARYMAPEQVQGLDVTPAADVYALGLVLLEALTGRPAVGGTVAEILAARVTRPPELGPEVPAEWRTGLGAMLQQAPARRPSAAEVRSRMAALTAPDLDATTASLAAVGASTAVMPAVLVPTDGPAVLPAPEPAAPRTPARRSWAPWALVGAAVLLVAMLAAVALGRDNRGTMFDDVTSTSTSIDARAEEAPATTARPAPTTTIPPTTVPPTTVPSTTIPAAVDEPRGRVDGGPPGQARDLPELPRLPGDDDGSEPGDA